MSIRAYKRLLDAVARIHRTELAPGTWPEALEAVAGCLGTHKAVTFRTNLGNGEVQGFQDLNIGEEAVAAYAAYYHHLDPWLQGFNPGREARSPFRCSAIISDPALRRTEYYNDFIKPLDMRFALSSIPVKSDGWMDVLTFFRGVDKEDFDDASMETFQVLLEHVAQALDVQRRIGTLENLSTGLAAALHRISQAVVLLDRDARIIHVNAAAELILNAADGLAVVDGHISAANLDAGSVLDRALRHVGEVTTTDARSQRRAVPVPRLSGRRPYVVRVAPVAQTADLLDSNDNRRSPCVLVLISDPDAGQRVPTLGELRDVYKLTPSEAALAAALAEGQTISEIADNQEIAVDTARKRLKAIFEKTDTHRQTELVQRLLLDFG